MAKMHSFEKIFVNSKMDYYFHRFFGIHRVLNQLNISKSSKILELGCGVGMTTKFIAKKFSESYVTALDYDSEQIKKAKEENDNKKVNFTVGDAANLNFSDNSYDIVFEILAFHHIPKYQVAIKEVFRVLKPGGKFIILDIPVKFFNPFHHFFFLQPAEFTKKEFTKFLKDAGFTITKNKGWFIFSVEARKPEKI